MTTTDTGLYVHIPFCLRKCRYCDFCSFAGLPDAEKNAYIAALLREIDAFPNTRDVKAVSVFFGGGTPSLLPPETVADILLRLKSKFNITNDAEITLEANPATVDRARLMAFRDAGVNRLSIGVQSFSDTELRMLGRVHSAEEAKQAIKDAHDAGFRNIGLDLIYAIPGQTCDSLRATLRTAIALSPTHISAYGLILEEGTDFYRHKDELPFLTDDAEAEMYDVVRETLEAAGYRQYEISNYARDGYESRHNLGYWQSRPYVGFGVAAYSLYGGRRYGNTRDLKKYIASPCDAVADVEYMTPENREYDYVMLAMRTRYGVDENAFRAAFGHGFYDEKRDVLEKYENAGYVIHENGVTRLSGKGFYLCDALLRDIL